MNEKIAKEITEAFRCAKCGEREASRRPLLEFQTSVVVGAVLDLIALTCRHCGYTELYEPDVLTGSEDRTDVPAKIFG